MWHMKIGGEAIKLLNRNQTIRFTTSEEDANDDSVDSFAECKYFATGTFPNQPASIISTIPAFLKGAEGVQFIDNDQLKQNQVHYHRHSVLKIWMVVVSLLVLIYSLQKE